MVAELSASLAVSASASLSLSASLALDPLVVSVSEWLAVRWLPAPAWQPDLDWLQLSLPSLRMSATAMATLSALISAQASCQAVLGIDLTTAAGVQALARIVATLNLRLGGMAASLRLSASWAALAAANAQITLVAQAAAAGSLSASADLGVSIAPWRPLIISIKALAPLISICQTLNLSPADPNLALTLSATIRALARLSLPALGNINLVLQLVAQLNAMAQLSASLGIDVRVTAFAQVQAMVAARAAALSAQLSASIRLQAGVLIGLPALQPNPSLLLNAPTIQLAAQFSASIVAGLNWQVPLSANLSLLAVGAPVIALIQASASLGLNLVMGAPCGAICDAASALQAA